VALRWKAPRVQPISDFFAEARGKRPSALFVAIRESGSRAGPREPVALAFIRGRDGSRGVIDGGFPTQSLRRVGDGGRTASDSPSDAPRARDMRCPSGSGWGEALVADAVSRNRRSAQQIMRLVRVKRQTGGAGRRKPAGPWPVRPRLVVHDVSDGASAPSGAHVVGSQGSKRGKCRATPPGSGGRPGGWGQTHSEVFLPAQRKLGAPCRRA